MHQAQVNIAFFSKIGQLSLGDWKQSEGEKNPTAPKRKTKRVPTISIMPLMGFRKLVSIPASN